MKLYQNTGLLDFIFVNTRATRAIVFQKIPSFQVFSAIFELRHERQRVFLHEYLRIVELLTEVTTHLF